MVTIRCFLAVELADLGSVYGHIQKNRGKPDMELSVHWATGVARGMSYLHGKDTVHRDLKSANGAHYNIDCVVYLSLTVVYVYITSLFF